MRGLKKALRILIVIGCLFVLFSIPRAQADCHSFSVSTNSPVEEGETVKVKVSRDGATDPSSVQLRTVNGDAKAPSDYEAVIKTVNFTNETSRTVEIKTNEDDTHEGSEAFDIRISGGKGCRSNMNYQYGPAAPVLINDDDKGKIPSTSPTPTPTAEPDETDEPTSEPSPTASPSAKPSKEPTASPEPTESAVVITPTPPDDDGPSPLLTGLAIGAFVLAAGGAFVLSRLRRASSG